MNFSTVAVTTERGGPEQPTIEAGAVARGMDRLVGEGLGVLLIGPHGTGHLERRRLHLLQKQRQTSQSQVVI